MAQGPAVVKKGSQLLARVTQESQKIRSPEGKMAQHAQSHVCCYHMCAAERSSTLCAQCWGSPLLAGLS